MRSAVLALVLAFGVPALADGAAAPPVAVAPTNDPEAVKFLKSLEDKIATQPEVEALESIKKLVDFWKDPAVKAETKAPIPGLVARFAKRRETPAALAGISGLVEIGKPEGSKNLLVVLAPLLERDDFDGDATKAVFAGLKKLADPAEAVVKALVDLFHYKNDVVVAKAVDALGGYREESVVLRRSLFEEVLKSFEGVESESHRPTNKAATNRWNIVGNAVNGTLAALAHRSFADCAAARQWFNDHRKDDDSWR